LSTGPGVAENYVPGVAKSEPGSIAADEPPEMRLITDEKLESSQDVDRSTSEEGEPPSKKRKFRSSSSPEPEVGAGVDNAVCDRGIAAETGSAAASESAVVSAARDDATSAP
jgi:hypothetical protein